MKLNKLTKYHYILLLLVLIVIIGTISLIYRINTDKDYWCEYNKPEFNISDDNNIKYCYGEGWSKYCKISYPQDCPSIKGD